jgi:hypothetical protein
MVAGRGWSSLAPGSGAWHWLAWLALHLITLLGGRNRISALVNMSSRYLTWRRGGGLIVGDDLAAGPAPLSGPAGRPATGYPGTDSSHGGQEPG